MANKVELRGLQKAFGACVANRDISLAIPAGTIHAIIGENGAGKSTAMKMLYGMIRPDAGEILIDGRPVSFRSPRSAARAGLGMVHQHFMLAGPCSGLDNILLGAEPTPGNPLARLLPPFLRPIDRAGALARLTALAAAYNFKVDFTAPVETLPVGVQQRLEILKLLYRDASVLILDEPTAVLTPQETDELFGNLRRLRGEGKTIIVITHKLKEVMRLADDVTVFRRGEVVARRPVAGATEEELAALMVGRAVRLVAEAPPPPVDHGPALELRSLTLQRKGHRPVLQDLTLNVRRGEVVGVAGVEGNGQTELLAVLANPRAHFHGRGRARASGTVEVLGRDARELRPLSVRGLGFGLVPEDRHRQGLVLSFDLARNFALGLHRSAAFCKAGLLRLGALRRRTDAAIAEFDIRPADSAATARGLSGGNQQKLVIARELARDPHLLVCAQPTRGVDVGSIEFIHQRLLAARLAGAGILLVSSSLEEIMALSDRIVVMYEGRIVGELARGQADETALGRLMAGGGGPGAC